MNTELVLHEIGLSEGEIKVYLALLKIGSTPVSKIKEKTNLHRTTIYDFLEKLINKSLVSYVVKNNVNFYSAVHPNKLLDFVNEKQENVKQILPKLIDIANLDKDEINVRVYKGVEGMKTLLNDVLREGKDFIAFGVEEKLFKEKFPFLMDSYFAKEKAVGIKERLLASEDTSFIFDSPTITYRFVPKNLFNPTPTMTFGDKVAMIIWEPLTIIVVKNKQLADSFRKHFELVWKTASRTQKKKKSK